MIGSTPAFLYLLPLIIVSLGIALIPPRVIWGVRYPFLLTNWLQWFLTAPLSYFMRDHNQEWPRISFFILSPLKIAYWAAVYVVLSPIRLVNAVYFDWILFGYVSIKEGLTEFLKPDYGNRSALVVILLWVLLMPWRFIKLCWRYAVVIFQSSVMTIFDLFWPTLTLFHGTPFDYQARDIARSGVWLVGQGNYVGTGIYFSIQEKVADYYARSNKQEVSRGTYWTRPTGTPAIIVSRVTLLPCRPVATLPESLRRQIGYDGDTISQEVKFPWASLQHWRHDKRWYEFCIINSKKGERVNSWRIRPLCIVKDNLPARLYGGPAVWPANALGWILLIITLLTFCFPLGSYTALNSSGFVTIPFPGNGISTVISSSPSPVPSRTPSPIPESCPGAPPMRVRVGDTVCVANLGIDRLNIRSRPRITDNIIGKLNQGTSMRVVRGPECAEGYTWWFVEVENGLEGWVAEGQTSRNYFLEDCE